MHRSAVTATAVALFVGLLVGVAVIGGVTVTTDSVAAQPTNETNITHHENPETVSERGDSARLRRWLSTRLTERLRESSVRISQGQYESAETVFGAEFEQRLGQYVDVAGETDSETTTGGDGDGGEADDSDTEEETAFERAKSQQLRLAELRQEYAETYDSYLEARQQGNSGAARINARRLRELANEIRQLGGTITRNLQIIENETGVTTTDTEQRIESVVRNVTERLEEIQTDTFVNTTLVVTTNRTAASFAEPAQIRGQIVTENDTFVANRSIRLRVGRRNLTTTTNANGIFTVTYRPVFISADADTVPVQYRPTATSRYLGAQANVSLAIEQVAPTLAVSVQPKQGQLRDTITVTAGLAVNGRPVPNVPIRASLPGQTLGTNSTGPEGQAQIRGQIPGGIPVSASVVAVGDVPENRAIKSITTSADIRLRKAPTDITLRTNLTTQGLVIRGRLVGLTEDNQTVVLPSQSVTVTVGTTTRTVETGVQGTYETTVPMGALSEADDGDTVLVRTEFDGNGTNLESSTARTRLNTSGLNQASEPEGTDLLIPVWAKIGLGGLVLLAGMILAWRRWQRSHDGDSSVGDESVPLAEEAGEPGEDDTDSPLVAARTALSNGATDTAVVTAYAAVRTTLIERFDGAESQTPRELLSACEDRLDPDAYTELNRLTDLYERTVFAPSDIDTGGQQAVDAAQSLLDSDHRQPQSGTPGDD